MLVELVRIHIREQQYMWTRLVAILKTSNKKIAQMGKLPRAEGYVIQVISSCGALAIAGMGVLSHSEAENEVVLSVCDGPHVSVPARSRGRPQNLTSSYLQNVCWERMLG
jgi:hypothetical protein